MWVDDDAPTHVRAECLGAICPDRHLSGLVISPGRHLSGLVICPGDICKDKERCPGGHCSHQLEGATTTLLGDVRWTFVPPYQFQGATTTTSKGGVPN